MQAKLGERSGAFGSPAYSLLWAESCKHQFFHFCSCRLRSSSFSHVEMQVISGSLFPWDPDTFRMTSYSTKCDRSPGRLPQTGPAAWGRRSRFRGRLETEEPPGRSSWGMAWMVVLDRFGVCGLLGGVTNWLIGPIRSWGSGCDEARREARPAQRERDTERDCGPSCLLAFPLLLRCAT